MRTVSNELFRLIKSLTKPEKGYFKKISKINTKTGDNNYIRLFDLIDRQKEYNESEIRKAFKGDIFLNQLPVAKNYLYKSILKSLNQFHAGNFNAIQINELYNSSLILYKKGLFSEGNKLIQKCKQLAYKYEKYEKIFEIIKLEFSLVISLNPVLPGEFVENFVYESNDAIEKLINVKDYKEVLLRLLLEFQKNRLVRKSEDRNTYKEILDHPLLADENNALSFESKLLFNQIFSNYYIAVEDDLKFYLHIKNVVELFESNEAHAKEFTLEFVSALNSCLMSILFLRKYNEADAVINKLKKIEESTTPYIKNIIFINSYNFVLVKYINTGEFEKGAELVPEIELRIKGLTGKKKTASEEKFDYTISYIYFGMGDHENSLKWLNKVLNKNQNEVRPDLLSFAHILNLIIHFELDNIVLLEYSVKSTYRFLYKRKKLYKVENAVLNFIRKAYGINSKEKLKENFIELYFNLKEITKDPYEKIALEYFDLLSWLESKIENKKFADVVKSKVDTACC
ncbi:MAG: hypothetical protein IPM38_18420 [Ignavibacteria bacterium]|nr:hypothetical protein [Ignavibacteria bacterium]